MFFTLGLPNPRSSTGQIVVST